MLLAVYAAFGAIVSAAYLQIDPLPRRAAPIAAPDTILVPDDAWQAWARHQTAFQARIEAVLRTRPIKAGQSSPAVPSHSSSSDPSLVSVERFETASATQPPVPTPKPTDLLATAKPYKPGSGVAGPTPTPALKPVELLDQPRQLLAMDRVRDAVEPASFWSRVAALFDPASASPIAANDGNDGGDQHNQAGGAGSGGQRDATERTIADGGAGAGGASVANGSGANSSSSGGSEDRGDNDRGTGNDRDAGNGDTGRDRGNDRGARNGDTGRSTGNDRSTGRDDNDRGAGRDRSRGNDRGAGRGDNDRNGADRGGRGNRGQRDDRGGRGKGRD